MKYGARGRFMPIFLSRCLGHINKGHVAWRVPCRVVIPQLLRDPEGCITHGLALPWGSGWHDSSASLSRLPADLSTELCAA